MRHERHGVAHVRRLWGVYYSSADRWLYTSRCESLAGTLVLSLSMTTTVRRWIGMLCIALLAFAIVGHVDTVSARAPDQVAYIDASTIGDQGESNKGTPNTSDHCCCAHPVSGHTAGDGVVLPAFGDRLTTPLSDDGAPTGVRDGPERPPRTTAS